MDTTHAEIQSQAPSTSSGQSAQTKELGLLKKIASKGGQRKKGVPVKRPRGNEDITPSPQLVAKWRKIAEVLR